MKSLVEQIENAFSMRLHPGNENITHCTYEKKYGGDFDGPCFECQDMAEFFRDKPWQQVRAVDLRQHGDADAQFTIRAYCYLLPAYLIGSINEPGDLDICVDHLTYRFGPKLDGELGEDSDQFSQDRLRQILMELRSEEIKAVLAYFRFALSRESDFDGFYKRSIENLDKQIQP